MNDSGLLLVGIINTNSLYLHTLIYMIKADAFVRKIISFTNNDSFQKALNSPKEHHKIILGVCVFVTNAKFDLG